MITARNYAAQAQHFLKNNIELFVKNGMQPDMSQLMVGLAGAISGAVHFSIPIDGVLLNGKWKSLIGKTIKLPYKRITIEYTSTEGKIRVVVLASQKDNYILVHPIYGVLANNEWVWFPNTLAATIDNIKQGVSLEGASVTDYDVFTFLRESLSADWSNNINTAVTNVIDLIEALSCKNVSTVNIQNESPKNAKRIRDGKLPFYETKILIVDTGKTINSPVKSLGGSHSSPRQHLRRGHIRRLPSGNYWVNSCVVGDPLKGRIDKQYMVRAGTK